MPRHSSRTVLVAAVLTYIGAGILIVAGPMFFFGAGDGTFLGQPAGDIVLAGSSIPIGAASAAGAVLTVVGVLLVVLAVLAQRGNPAGRTGLTVIGAVAIIGLVYTVLTGDWVSALAPLAWIVLALVLLWVGRTGAAAPAVRLRASARRR